MYATLANVNTDVINYGDQVVNHIEDSLYHTHFLKFCSKFHEDIGKLIQTLVDRNDETFITRMLEVFLGKHWYRLQ